MTNHFGTQPGLIEKEKQYIICLGVCNKMTQPIICSPKRACAATGRTFLFYFACFSLVGNLILSQMD